MSDCATYMLSKQDKAMYEDDFSDTSEESKVENLLLLQKDSVTFVTVVGIRSLIQQKCKEVGEILNIHDDDALILLNHYKWRVDLLQNDWFENQTGLPEKAGIKPQETIEVKDSPEVICSKCYQTKSREEFDSLKCKHLMCEDCWIDYIQTNVTRPENAFFWRCPVEGCNLVVPDSFNQKYIPDEKMVQYEKRKVMTYTHNSKTFKWCPTPNCQYGADITDNKILAIECQCGYVYCNECGSEDHKPVWVCEVAVDWIKRCNEQAPFNQVLISCISNFKRCEAELKNIEELSQKLNLEKARYSKSMIDMIQGAYKTLRDTKRLQKWSYAFQPFINEDLDCGLLLLRLQIRQEKFEKHTRELQELLKDCLEENDISGYEQYRERIQKVESSCKMASSIFFSRVAVTIRDAPQYVQNLVPYELPEEGVRSVKKTMRAGTLSKNVGVEKEGWMLKLAFMISLLLLVTFSHCQDR